MKKFLSIGLMSGTSMDGIDAALIETNGRQHVREIACLSATYDGPMCILLKGAEVAMQRANGNMLHAEENFLSAIQQYLQNEFNLPEEKLAKKIIELKSYLSNKNSVSDDFSLQTLVRYFTTLHADVVTQLLEKQSLSAKEIDVIGFHGQTLLHKPAEKISIQIGDGKQLAKQLNINVINNFRNEDILNGGQGAPLAPLFHFVLAKNNKKIPAVVVNCGGIANVSIFPDDDIINILGFDTGPGNNLIDRYVKHITQGQLHMDKDAEFGKKGKVNANILKSLYAESIAQDGNPKNYFDQAPPKSLDSSDLKLIPAIHSLSREDACRTLAAFTADSIVKGVKDHSTIFPNTWILCGGGWNNPVIHTELQQRLKEYNSRAYLAKDVGWNSQSLEAQMFAYFAVRHLENLPISFPKTTRVSKPSQGGVLHRI